MNPSAAASFADAIQRLGVDPAHVSPFGPDMAKISPAAVAGRTRRGKLILVSAMTPTPAGEGKTTTAIGLAQGLQGIGKRAALALRQPSMGPVFGRKGGATGAGLSALAPADRINLHFTGDFHAITAANNLLAAAIDNRLHAGDSRLAPDRVTWKRVMDVNDRALRSILTGQGGQGVPRATGFDITAASEIMAILCLAESPPDLRARLDRIVVGQTSSGEPVTAQEIRVTGALMAILRDALQPNLVRSISGVPALLHGGPFANIAHGCNSVIATRTALLCADYAVTEAGFAFDLGGEKFVHIKCRSSGLAPDAIVLVVTHRALRMHGGVGVKECGAPNPGAVARGLDNLAAHLDAAACFERPVVVAINRFPTDTPEEDRLVADLCGSRGVPWAACEGVARGAEGAAELAEKVVEAAARPAPALPMLYRLDDSPRDKVRAIATHLYGAADVEWSPVALEKLERLAASGTARLPVCMAKTQNSLSDDPKAMGRPRGFTLRVRDVELAAGAGFLVVLTGDIMRMPALPKLPAAERIDLHDNGEISGL